MMQTSLPCREKVQCVRGFLRRMCLVFMCVLMPCAVYAGPSQGIIIGGYDVAKLTNETISILMEKGIVSAEFGANARGRVAASVAADPLISAVPVVDLYAQIFSRLIDRGIATQEEVQAIRKTASQSGGVKAGGVNPVLLAASCLDLLSKKGLISQKEAQRLLDVSQK